MSPEADDLPADEQAWLDALAGRRRDADGPPAAREGMALREMVLARAGAAELSPAVPDPERERRLIERARGVGLIPAAPRSAAHPFVGLAAAAVLGLVLVAGVVLRRGLPPPQPVETTRGNRGGIVRLEAADPVALQREIVSGLAACGVPATGYERLGLRGVDADLPEPQPACVAALLARHHVAAPEDGVLRIEIASRITP